MSKADDVGVADLGCEVVNTNDERVERLRPLVESLDGVTDIFRALSDPTRAKIVYCLSHEELCVCDLASLFHMTPPAISHHLRLLRDLRLVRVRREGRFTYYSLADDHVISLIQQTTDHVLEHAVRKG